MTAAPQEVETLISTSELTKRFGSLAAVAGVDLDVHAGRVTALIGPNGAGKSTLVNLLSGLTLPTTGGIRFRGEPVTGMHAWQLAQLGIARTFQTPRLFDGGLTAVEVIMLAQDARERRPSWFGALFGADAMASASSSGRTAAGQWLDFVGLEDAADVPATSLPIGSQRLLDVARALAMQPTLLLLDEPAAGLDASESAGLAKLIRRIAAGGTGVVLVEHDMGIVMSIADQVVVLDQGSVIATGPPAEIAREPRVIEAYLGVDEA
jgi:ABC-type branched-subunit amino acid transport system ATPase component